MWPLLPDYSYDKINLCMQNALDDETYHYEA